MLWSNATDLTSVWAVNAQKGIDNGATALLGFNEPDLCVPGSACMSLKSSVSAWKTYMQPFAGKALLGSPAVTNGGSTGTNYMGADYLNYFIGNCTGCQIDFVNMHWYSNIYAGVNYLQTQVENIRAVAGGRPIWITEFAIDSSYAYTEAQLEAFVEAAVVYLDSQPDVHRYAYFMDAAGILMNNAGTAMSNIGQLFDVYNGTAIDFSSPSSSSSSSAAKSTTSSSGKTSSTVSSTLSTYSLSSSTSVSASSTTASVSSLSSTSTSAISSTTTPALISISIGSGSTTSSLASPTVSTTSSAQTTLSTLTSTSSSLSSTKTSAVTTSTPSITILSAFFAMKDVTTLAQKAYSKNNGLTIPTKNPGNVLGGNPWRGHPKKSLSILYSVSGSDQTYVFTTMTGTGSYTLSPQTPISAKSALTPSLPAAEASITIVGVTWGGVQITDSAVWSKIYAAAAQGKQFTMNPAFFGVDPLPGVQKTAVVWYMQGGALQALSGVGGKAYRF